ncbi:MAG: glycosyltransferase family 2 protein [Bacteroidales bacterium]|nr:glycosyltransferase family 2 protein [Bacteroidales bacterium]
MDKVAIVILNWNGEKFLKKYLPALVANTPHSFGNEGSGSVSIVVADNCSSDNSISWLQENHPQIRTIVLDRNYGFTGGYNRALAQVEAEYFILLNSDILVPRNWLQPLISYMDTHPQVGICQPKMLSEARHQQLSVEETGKEDLTGLFLTNLSGGKYETFEYAGACGGYLDVLGFPFCRGRVLSSVEEDRGQYDSAVQCFWASGACMVVRSSVWRELGGLDEGFFAHMEEIDFCWRAQLAGHKVWCVPQSHVFHVGGGTLPNNSPRKLFLNYRNNLLMLYKNLPLEEGWEAFGLKKINRNLYIFIRMCVDGLTGVAYLLQFKWSFFTAVIKAHNAFRSMKKGTAVTLPDNRRATPFGISRKSLIIEKLLGRNIKF